MDEEENEETREEVSEESEETREEVSEERAREDEVAHDETNEIMAAIAGLQKQIDALSVTVSSFAEMGGVIRETTEPTTEVMVTDAGAFEDDEVVIDDDVVRDIDNIVFDD